MGLTEVIVATSRPTNVRRTFDFASDREPWPTGLSEVLSDLTVARTRAESLKMQLRDLREVPFDEVLEADVCIVGTGPAGLTLAHELSVPHVRVVVLESGGRERDVWHDDLNEVENVGAQRQTDQWKVRNRLLGGTSTTWSGKLATFDDIDFAHRPWVPGSGWPFRRETLRPYLVRSAPYLGTCVADNTRPLIRSAAATRWPNLDPRSSSRTHGRIALTRASRRVPFVWTASAQRTEMPGVTCYLHASVTHLDTDAAARHVARVEVRTPENQRHYVPRGTWSWRPAQSKTLDCFSPRIGWCLAASETPMTGSADTLWTTRAMRSLPSAVPTSTPYNGYSLILSRAAPCR